MTSEDRHVLGARAVASLSVTFAVAALGTSLRLLAFDIGYFWHNQTAETVRLAVVQSVLGAALVVAALAVAWLLTRGRTPRGVAALEKAAALSAPLGPLAVLPCLFDYRLWNGHALVFLALVVAVALALGATVSNLPSSLARMRPSEALPRFVSSARAPLVAAVALSAGYVLWFSYYTVVWHRSVRSGYDLAIEDNILWNLLRGRFFHAAPTLGPTGSHFGRHATLVSYLLLPVYALHQSAETVLVIQSALLGLAAIPLFLFARRRIGAWPAVIVSAAYLLHPAVQEGNLYEAHYVKFGNGFFWAALWLLDSGRRRWALLAALVTLTVREDVATWVILLGAYAWLSGKDVRLGAFLVVLASLYVGIVKFVVMPMFREGRDDLVFMYQDLLPKGRGTFAWVLVTVLGNPAFTVESLLEQGKLLYFLQVLVPLGLLPLRRKIGWFALIPGLLYCFLGTHYWPLIDIHYQYSAHLVAFLFPALVLVLEDLPVAAPLGGRGLRRGGALASLAAATLACSYQFGAVLQQHTSFGGPVAYKFGWDAAGRERGRAMTALLSVIPGDARVAGSAAPVAQISTRENGYSLSLGLYDADWIVAPSVASEYVGSELERTRSALASGEFGVVALEGPFFAAKRGAVSALTATVLQRLERGARR